MNFSVCLIVALFGSTAADLASGGTFLKQPKNEKPLRQSLQEKYDVYLIKNPIKMDNTIEGLFILKQEGAKGDTRDFLSQTKSNKFRSPDTQETEKRRFGGGGTLKRRFGGGGTLKRRFGGGGGWEG